MLKDGSSTGRKPHLKVFQISSLKGGDNGLFVLGHVNKIPCRMIVDAGANVTIIRTDLAHNLARNTSGRHPALLSRP